MSDELRTAYSPAQFWVRLFLPFALTLALTLPALLTVFSGAHINPVVGALYFGVAIVAAAFMLGWVGEAAELDISGGLAIGLLAVIAILPEYIVSIYFAFAAGSDPSMASYASANLTGANRLLLGFGWPAIALIGYLALRVTRKRREAKREPFGIKLESDARTDLGFLLLASVLAFIVPITGQIHLVLGVAMVALFIGYLWRVSHSDREEPELHGTAALVGALPKWGRRAFILITTAAAAAIILACAEPFAHNLIEAGETLGVDKFILVQWLAPLASEAPEFTLAILFAVRGKAAVGLAVLVSSKVNQWTALAGSLPIAYVVGGGENASLPMDARQVEEFTLTAAQTLLGVAILLALRLSFKSAALLFVLFAATFVFPQEEVRWVLAYIYLVLAAGYAIYHRKYIRETFRSPFQKP